MIPSGPMLFSVEMALCLLSIQDLSTNILIFKNLMLKSLGLKKLI